MMEEEKPEKRQKAAGKTHGEFLLCGESKLQDKHPTSCR